MLDHNTLACIAKEVFAITENTISSYEEKAKKQDKTLEDYMLGESLVDENTLYQEAAARLCVPFVRLSEKEIMRDVLQMIPPTVAQTHKIIAFNLTDAEIFLALLDVTDLQMIEFIQKKTGRKPILHLTTPSEIKETLTQYHANLDQDITITQLTETKKSTGELKKAAEELPIINIVNSILEHAVYENASDIHIEPAENDVVVRYRVDGILKSVMALPDSAKNGIIARVKILSSLKIDEHMVPQDGRFKIQVQDEKYSFRVSIIPVYDGEKVVLRLLHEGTKPLTLGELGLLPKAKETIERTLKKPHGMVLVTGPTGSGKTTTLYSILGILNTPDVNISTIEDPVEYHVDGINQSQVNARTGFTFAKGLRAFLRQDPDIMMVGEIRDQETAEIAIHAAMTGHLVLSTLHTNNAAGTLPRLIDMGIPPFLISSTTNVIVAQRLVRKLEEKTATPTTLEKQQAEELETLIDMKTLFTLLKEHDISLKKEETSLANMVFYTPEPTCVTAKNTGYKGRIGIYEVLEITDEISDSFTEKTSEEDIKKLAKKQGVISMIYDGIIKAKQGITTIDEVLRVTRE
ncbi:MAG: type II/IV secretion system protein [Candidatus Magasanikbacteria bacterium]|jgi:type IV pilus assembly protein PilB|nr:type II/IV secretion system protein [Candidatus Magasanikbacteria bacterium]MBT5262729.1 type II/IV secretion system protein [Candidatus Magasanikbacteria bacterium]MBT5820596.1 type II/IV secretion system protein [Candidatus Magasanikbacteria bacterium]MBT6294221.1 type II/IV secretion system protein [Candidatus Magasanikbacteria bacterium]